MAITITTLPQLSTNVCAETAALENLGDLGTVPIGSKEESGNWYKLFIEGEPVFCLDLGKTCHSGDTYEKESTNTIKSNSEDVATSMKAKIGFWYYVTVFCYLYKNFDYNQFLLYME